MRRVLLGWILSGLVLGLACAPAQARTLLLKVDGQERGRLPVIVTEEGVRYVSLNLLARLLKVKPRWGAKTSKAIFKVGEQTVRLTKDRSRALVHAAPVQLSAPPRVRRGDWVVPEEFVTRLLPRILPRVTVVVKAPPPAKPGPTSVAGDPTLVDLRFRSYPSFTRVVLEASGRFRYAMNASPGRKALGVVLSGLFVEAARVEEVADGLVHRLRLERREAGPVLIVDLEAAPRETRVLVLEEPFRLVLDLYRGREARSETEPSVSQTLRLIVVDPGHGGDEVGAVGPSGIMEKDVVLDVARRLARMVEEELGINVALTRTDDVSMPLRDRTTFANAQDADLFISIHANAHRASASRGVEVYFLSSEATDDEARQLAALENRGIQLDAHASGDQLDALKTILWDLAQSEFMEESSRLAETVLDSMTRSLKIGNRGVKQAGFYVLGGAAMPAILVEIGFLTNKREERKLMSSSYRERVARAIYTGLAAYKRRYDRKMKASVGGGRE
ncbi:MAG: N-acetylmuramoyl-L-alanine amidase [Candidatus Methylomirabilia bacterium]